MNRIAGVVGMSSRLGCGEDHVGIEGVDTCDVEFSGVVEDCMSGRNVQRKLGTTRGSPRRSRTAKASRIRLTGEIAVCLRVGRMGPTSEDGPGQHNPDRSEGPWGKRRTAVSSGSTGPTSSGVPATDERGTKGGRKPPLPRGMPGAGLTRGGEGKAPSEKLSFQPY